MNNWFKIDSSLYKYATYLYYTLILSILWFIGSIPIITIGASNTALLYISSKIIRKEDFSLYGDFFKSYKNNFLRSTILFLILGFFAVVFTVNINLYIFNPTLPRWTMAIQILLILELCMVTIYAFPMLARYEMSTIEILKASILIGNKHIGSSLQCLIFIITVLALVTIFPGLFMFLCPGLIGLSNYYLLNKVFKGYSQDLQSPTED